MVLLAKDLIQKGSSRWLVNIAKLIGANSKLTSSYAGATAGEIYIIDRAGEYSGPCFEHLIEIYMAIGRKEPKPITYCPFCGRKL